MLPRSEFGEPNLTAWASTGPDTSFSQISFLGRGRDLLVRRRRESFPRLHLIPQAD